MPRAYRIFIRHLLPIIGVALGLAGCSGPSHESKQITTPSKRAPMTAAPAPTLPPPAAATPPSKPAAPISNTVMLGIDVLEADGFAAVKGKRLGLLTHPAGVNRQGVSTIDVLRRAPGVKLVALYAVEHGIYNEIPAEIHFPDQVDRRTGLTVFSLYNGKTKSFVPTHVQLQSIDALVIDLQDIGTRSYTFSGAMKSAMEACFASGKEVIVLDRPNPLGGLTVSGPPMDSKWMSDVGRFRVPYVYGLTIGELALLAKDLAPPAGLAVSTASRTSGKLTVIPMRGWRRSMRWPETGLNFVPTSSKIRDFETCATYPTTGLGCMFGGFRNGIGSQYIFRGVSHASAKPEVIERELRSMNLPGVTFTRTSLPNTKAGQPAVVGFLINITDEAAWQPAELNFRLMKLACKLEKKNPFTKLSTAQERTLLIHLGSEAFYRDLKAKGANIDVDRWLQTWREQARVFQEQSKKYWLYR